MNPNARKRPAPPSGAGQKFNTAYRAVLDVIDRISFWGIALVMGLMTAIVSIQVLVRYGFNFSIDSADELSRLFFVWSMFLAIPHGIKIGIHVGIDLVVRQFNERIQTILFKFVCTLSAILMVLVFYVGFIAVADKWPELMPTLPVSAGTYYVAVLISAGHSFLHLVYLAWQGPDAWETEGPQ